MTARGPVPEGHDSGPGTTTNADAQTMQPDSRLPRLFARMGAAVAGVLTLALVLSGSLWAPAFTDAAWQETDETTGSITAGELGPVQDLTCQDSNVPLDLTNKQVQLSWVRPDIPAEVPVNYEVTWSETGIPGRSGTVTTKDTSYKHTAGTNLLNLTVNFTVTPVLGEWVGNQSVASAYGLQVLLSVILTCSRPSTNNAINTEEALEAELRSADESESATAPTSTGSDNTSTSPHQANADTAIGIATAVTSTSRSSGRSTNTSVPATSSAANTKPKSSLSTKSATSAESASTSAETTPTSSRTETTKTVVPTTSKTVVPEASETAPTTAPQPEIAIPDEPGELSPTARIEDVDTITVGEDELDVVVVGDEVPSDARGGAAALEIWLDGGSPSSTWATFASDDPDEDGWRWAAINQKTGTIVYIV